MKFLMNLEEIKNKGFFKFSKPVGFILENKKYDLEKNTWGCLIKTFVKMLDDNFSKVKFDILQHFIDSGNFSLYLSNDKEKFIYPSANNFIEFKKNIYLNLNLSSGDVINFFLKVFEILNYSKDDLEIIYIR